MEEFSGSTLKTTYASWKPPESVQERSFFHLQVSVKNIKGDLEEEDCSPPALFLQKKDKEGHTEAESESACGGSHTATTTLLQAGIIFQVLLLCSIFCELPLSTVLG